MPEQVLGTIALGAPLPEDVRNAAMIHRSGDRQYANWSEVLGDRRRQWTITSLDEKVISLSLWSEGPWEQLLPDYDSIVCTLVARHGVPTTAPPDEDEQRHVDLDPTGLPDDRWWHLRSRAWEGAVRANVSLYKTWPSRIELRLGAELAALR